MKIKILPGFLEFSLSIEVYALPEMKDCDKNR